MMLLKCFFIFIYIAGFKSCSGQQRITYGRESILGRKYAIYFVKSPYSKEDYDSSICGGALVSANQILTAAACLVKTENIYAIAGYKKYVNSKDINKDACTMNRKQKVVKIYVPKGYELSSKNTATPNLDIGVAMVEKPYNFSDLSYRVQCSYEPATIFINYDQKFQAPGMYAVALGWGASKATKPKNPVIPDSNSKTLLESNTQIKNSSECQNCTKNEEFKTILKKYMLCTSGTGHVLGNGSNNGNLKESCYIWRRQFDLTKVPDDNICTDEDFEFRRTNENYTKTSIQNLDKNISTKSTTGICQNDHGSPLISWAGIQEVLIGVALNSIYNANYECVGPYFFISTANTADIIKCLLDTDPITRQMCNEEINDKRFQVQEIEIKWSEKPIIEPQRQTDTHKISAYLRQGNEELPLNLRPTKNLGPDELENPQPFEAPEEQAYELQIDPKRAQSYDPPPDRPQDQAQMQQKEPPHEQPYEQVYEHLYERQQKQPKESYNPLQVESYKESKLESFKQPQVESSDRPLVETFKISQMESYKQPTMESYNQPHMLPYKEPQEESYNQPPMELYKERHVDSFKQPQVDSYNQPQIETYSQPRVESYNQPQAQSYNEPQAESYNQAQIESYNQPQPDSYKQRPIAPYNEPQVESSNQPQIGSYNQPQVQLYNQPQEGSFSQQQLGSYNQPQLGSYNQPQLGSYNQPQVQPQYKQTQIESIKQTTEDSYNPLQNMDLFKLPEIDIFKPTKIKPYNPQTQLDSFKLPIVEPYKPSPVEPYKLPDVEPYKPPNVQPYKHAPVEPYVQPHSNQIGQPKVQQQEQPSQQQSVKMPAQALENIQIPPLSALRERPPQPPLFDQPTFDSSDILPRDGAQSFEQIYSQLHMPLIEPPASPVPEQTFEELYKNLHDPTLELPHEQEFDSPHESPAEQRFEQPFEPQFDETFDTTFDKTFDQMNKQSHEQLQNTQRNDPNQLENQPHVLPNDRQEDDVKVRPQIPLDYQNEYFSYNARRNISDSIKP